MADYLSTIVALLLFNISRYCLVDYLPVHYHGLVNFLHSNGVIRALLIFPLLMLAVYAVGGNYDFVIQRSRLKELFSTIAVAFVGTLLYFFLALINDYIPSTTTSYEMLLVLFILLTLCVYIPRALITNRSSRKIHSGEWGYNTLIVGTTESARQLAASLSSSYRSMALKVVGFVNTIDGFTPRSLDLPVYDIDNLSDVIERHNIQKLIVVTHRHGRKATIELINRLFPYDLSIFITPDLYQLMTMRSKLSDVRALPLVDISRSDMSPMTLNLKRISDIVVSSLALLLLSPVLAAIAIAVKRDSDGPILYRQERIGYHKRPFKIIKFRTMAVDAEPNGPALSSENDPRITSVGRFLRKYRLDELPNFWNVLRGDMSLVGPRPEREFFIRQITERAPYYTMVHQVRPGITSWGMVQYGYANTVDGMVERLKYDLIYLENVSLLIDLKILIHTVKIVFTGRGM